MDARDLAASVAAVLLPHPNVRSVELVGSRATDSATPLSDWDFEVETDDFDSVARALPELVTPLDPLAQQWDRISDYPCYMLMLAGPAKVDLIFPGEPYESLPPWTVTPEHSTGSTSTSGTGSCGSRPSVRRGRTSWCGASWRR